ncbi:nucleoside deaminase [Ralstonia sp. 25C]|uniref:nucleoside deaminase n=1 Tax=Ralstonia sp. 25C TaxID=3447363 RepID=UPI003F74E7E3
MSDIKGTFTDVDRAMDRASDMATSAYCQGTFSVGGNMLDARGDELHALHNTVVVDGITHDPTAHGERQLVDWYYEQVANGTLMPPPEDITIVTSLDPCCMCTGSILTAGFRAVVGAYDDYAGINYDFRAEFPSLSPELQAKARATFSYPEVDGDKCFSRPATGASLPEFFTDQTVSQHNVALCKTLFEATVGSVKETINTDLPQHELRDPADLEDTDPLVVALRDIYPDALKYVAPSRGTPDEGLARYLLDTARLDIAQGGNGNAVAMLDWFGNLLMCLPGNLSRSPILTAFMQTTRAYAQLRERLIKNPSVGEQKTRQYLGHPKYGVFVFINGPDDSSQSLVDLGAYGSTMEGPVPPENPIPFQYVIPTMEPTALTAYCQKLPPLYSASVVVRPRQVESTALIEAMTNALLR